MTAEPHFIALIVPVPREKHSSARNRRRREAALLAKAREIRIDGMSLATFRSMSVFDQFAHMFRSVPDGWRPVSFKESP